MEILKEIGLASTSCNLNMRVTTDKQAISNKYNQSQHISTADYERLLGCWYLLVMNNEEFINDYNMDILGFLKSASLCNNHLYIGNFEGYYITDRIKLVSIFINKYDTTTAMLLDTQKDRFFYCNI